jgi:hypothetical protein
MSDLREQKNAEEYIKSKKAEVSTIEDLPESDYDELSLIAKDIEK